VKGQFDDLNAEYASRIFIVVFGGGAEVPKAEGALKLVARTSNSPSHRAKGRKIYPAWFAVKERRALIPISDPDTSPLIRSKVFQGIASNQPGKPGEKCSRDPLDNDKHLILL